MVIYMKDIPVFTTEDGASTLILKEVPYKHTAYVRVQSVQPGGLEPHLKECVSFCRMLDAERVYAAGHPELESWPLHCAVLTMERPGTQICSCEELQPVTGENVSRWRNIYNERMVGVDNAATLTALNEKEILSSGGAWFVRQGAELLGIGWVRGREIAAIAAVKPGAGELVLRALLTTVDGGSAVLEVASTNHRAIALYEKVGFAITGEVSRWYKIL